MRYNIDRSTPTGRLTITITAAEQKMYGKLAKERGEAFGTDDTMAELFEELLANSNLEWIDPAETGDLTSAPMVGLRDGDGKVSARWAFMNYQDA